MVIKGYWTVLILLATPYLSFAINSNSTDIKSRTGDDLNKTYELRIATIYDKSFAENYEKKRKAEVALEKVLDKVGQYFSDGEFKAKLKLVVVGVSAIKTDMSNVTEKIEEKIVLKTLSKYGGNEDIYLIVRGSNEMNIDTNVEKGGICHPMRTKRTIVVTITKDMTDQYAALFISRFIGRILGMGMDYDIKDGKIQEKTRFRRHSCLESNGYMGDCLKSNGIMGDWLAKNSVSNVMGFSQCSREDWDNIYAEYETFCLKPAFSEPTSKWGGRCRNAYWKKCNILPIFINQYPKRYCRNRKYKIDCPKTCLLCDEDKSSSVCQNYYFDDTCKWLEEKYKCAKRGEVYLYCSSQCQMC